MDVSQYLEIFIDESEEHLQTLSDCIMVLEKEPDAIIVEGFGRGNLPAGMMPAIKSVPCGTLFKGYGRYHGL